MMNLFWFVEFYWKKKSFLIFSSKLETLDYISNTGQDWRLLATELVSKQMKKENSLSIWEMKKRTLSYTVTDNYLEKYFFSAENQSWFNSFKTFHEICMILYNTREAWLKYRTLFGSNRCCWLSEIYTYLLTP